LHSKTSREKKRQERRRFLIRANTPPTKLQVVLEFIIGVRINVYAVFFLRKEQPRQSETDDQLSTFGQRDLATGRLAKDLSAASANNNSLGMAEDSGNVCAARAPHILHK
jgi:hypothetical protein